MNRPDLISSKAEIRVSLHQKPKAGLGLRFFDLKKSKKPIDFSTRSSFI